MSWISVKDEPPYVNSEVLVVIRARDRSNYYREVSMSVYYEEGFDIEDENAEVTHWQYKPALPKTA